VPSVVRSDAELVEANSKLGVLAGLFGFVAVIPAGLLQIVLGTPATLVYGALLFVLALVAAMRLPPERAHSAADTPTERRELHSRGVTSAAAAMAVLRACVGFLLFHLAFWLREQDAGLAWFGAAVVMSSLATMFGNAIAPLLRSRLAEESLLLLALALPAAAGLVCAVFGGEPAAVVLAVAVNLAAALGRLGFESIVQRDAPSADRGRTFARFETRFQLGWVLAATVPVVLPIPGAVGFTMVGAAAAVAAVRYRRAGHMRAVARRAPVTRP
jgi:hypothetical protein